SVVKSSSLLIKNGTVVNAHQEFKGDVFINDGKIVAVGPECYNPELMKNMDTNTRVIDATGKYVIPGGIDPHVHLEMPFMGTVSVDGYLEGTRAALAGGTTCLVDFIIPKKGQPLGEAYDAWMRRADGNTCCDYSFHCAITYWDENIPHGMEDLIKRGVSSFKIFLAYKGSLQVNDEETINILKSAKSVGGITMAHCENADLIVHGQQRLVDAGVLGPEGHYYSRPDECEAEATHRMITMAQSVNTPLYVVHVMSQLAADEVSRGRRKGHVVFGETLASTLGVDGTQCSHPDWRHAAGYVMSPPLNPDPTTKEKLMKAICAGDIQIVSSDNCTFRTDQKLMGKDSFVKIPNGVNGIEDRLAVVWTKGVQQGLLTPSDFVRVTSTAAAQVFNMYPRKGVIQPGSDADVVIWDGDRSRTVSRQTHHHGVDFNIFEGMTLQGVAETTISNGVVKWEFDTYTNEDIEKHRGSGNLIKRDPFGFCFSRIPYLDAARDPKKVFVDRNSGSVNSSTAPTLTSISPLPSPEKAASENILRSVEPFKSIEDALSHYVHDLKVREEMIRILYGSSINGMKPQPSGQSADAKANDIANSTGFRLGGVYQLLSTIEEEIRPKRIVRIAALQNSIVSPTDAPIETQKRAIMDKIEAMLTAAAFKGANVACLQECWTSPFFMCTRERYPWVEFAEDPEIGESTMMIKELAKKYNMVILSPILEKDKAQGVLHNSCVFVDNHGKYLGLQRKNHIPRVGDFNESSYYMEGDTGHAVFETEFGKIAANICYGRHHPLNWYAYGLNGAEIVFNPSATIGALSEPLWGIEARTAAVANSYFTVAINRVGTETFPRAFTSGDGLPAHRDFGHFYGSSYITAPTGQRTPGLSRTENGVLLCDVDLNLCDQTKQKWQLALTARLPMYADFFQKFCAKK
ncbi:unnamed protein product, partial [Ectocarpus fasciculatus]